MNEKEKSKKLQQYYQKVTELFGFKLWGYDCQYYGDKAVMQIVYCDYKTVDAVREELQKMMPEVELATVKREISDAARLMEIYEVMGSGKDGDVEIMVHMPNGDAITLSDWAVGRLYNQDLSDDTYINYSQSERKDPNPNDLYRYLHE